MVKNHNLVEVAQWNVANVPAGCSLLQTPEQETEDNFKQFIRERTLFGLYGRQRRLHGHDCFIGFYRPEPSNSHSRPKHFFKAGKLMHLLIFGGVPRLLAPWRSLDEAASLTCQITSQYYNKLGCF